MSEFTWIPIYREISDRVLQYRKRQNELIDLLREVNSQGLPVIPFKDLDIGDVAKDIEAIDPFTFFATFNRGITRDKRLQIVEILKTHWSLVHLLPDDFDGIPVVNNMRSWFFHWKKDRTSDEISNLWELARFATQHSLDELPLDLLDKCIQRTSLGMLTMGMFWMNPHEFLSLDHVNRKYLKQFGLDGDGVRTAQQYLDFVKRVKAEKEMLFPEISLNAWTEANATPKAPKEKQPKAPVVQDSEPSGEKNFWWLNANPKQFHFDELKVGETQVFTTHSPLGNKSRKYQYFQAVKPGDFVLGYITTPQREIVAVCEISKGIHQSSEGESIEIRMLEHFDNAVSLDDLKANSDLENCEPIKNNQGTLFTVTADEFETIRALIDDINVPVETEEISDYTRADALREMFFSEAKLDGILARLRRKKNIILKGPPGVGKTFIAKRLAFLEMGKQDKSRVEMIQFHQSYTYEDFIQGYRLNEKGDFVIKPGIFYDFCRRAQRSEKPHFFVIDEINRGNLSKIFGELMMLIEHDKRGPNFDVPLTYSRSAEERFHVPENVYIIGTMNTADRSLSLVDYALRRRFAFVDLVAEFESDKFRKQLSDNGAPKNLVDKVVKGMTALNNDIASDHKNLGHGFCIGHSYFCPTKNTPTDEAWFRQVVESEIRPLLEEYWLDDEQKVLKLVNRLLDQEPAGAADE
jgi:5-methylcytosine-specific restriction protein B